MTDFRVGFYVSLVFCVIAAMALAGCAHTEPRVVYKEVRVPISVPCRVTLPDEPAYATAGLSLDAPLFDMVRALLVEREQRKARDVEVTAAARSCR